MDFVSPIVGAVTGIEMAQWKDILIFALKVIVFTIPFVVIGLLVERDVVRVPSFSRLIKSFTVFAFFLPVFSFGILNYVAPGIPDAFWERHPLLEGFWIMEGKVAPLVLSSLAFLYLVLYVVETWRGDLSE